VGRRVSNLLGATRFGVGTRPAGHSCQDRATRTARPRTLPSPGTSRPSRTSRSSRCASTRPGPLDACASCLMFIRPMEGPAGRRSGAPGRVPVGAEGGKRRRVQVAAWTLVYSRRMDSQYAGTVAVAEVVVQFSSVRAGWTSSLSSSWFAADVPGDSTSAGLITVARAIATRSAVSSSKPRFTDWRLRSTSGATRGGKTMQPISGRRWHGSMWNPRQ
jgi:hypothetical protein